MGLKSGEARASPASPLPTVLIVTIQSTFGNSITYVLFPRSSYPFLHLALSSRFLLTAFIIQMHALPNTTLEFINNSASEFGGAIAVDNFKGGNDITLILNNMCFIQYNIGSEYEYDPNKWNVS